MSKLDDQLDEMLNVGTPQCGLFAGILAFITGLLLVFLGFFKTILIVAIVATGVFLGAVKNKKEAVRSLVNRIFPPKDSKITSNEKNKAR